MSQDQPGIPPLPKVVPIEAMQTFVGDELIDANGHMGAAHYFQVFHNGLHRLFRPLGFGEPYRQRGFTVFQREAHIAYELELRRGDPIDVRTWLIGYDERCVHHYHEMRKGEGGPRVASVEYLTVNVALATRRSVEFPEDVSARLHTLAHAFESVAPPAQTGRRIALRGNATRVPMVR